MADGGNVVERFQQAVQHRLSGDYDQAEAILKSVLTEQPNDAAAHHELGLVYSYRALMDESLQHLYRACQLQPSSTKFMTDLGKTFAMFGEDDKAKMAFQHVLRLDPTDEEAKKQLSYLGG